MVTVRVFLAIVAQHSWPLHQLDINNAFLHGFVDEELYMSPPDGYTKAGPRQVCRLRRSLYGLKQASRQWNNELTSHLVQLGFMQSAHDSCLFIKATSSYFLALLVYVDDVLITGDSEMEIASIKASLDKQFTIKDLGQAKYFLGLEIARTATGLYVNQRKYAMDIVTDAGLLGAKAAAIPLPKDLRLTQEDAGPLLPNPDAYRRMVGRLLYLGFTRPDLAYSTQQLSQFVNAPCQQHWDAALRVVRYLKGTLSRGLCFSSKVSTQLIAYSDADWASCKDTRRSLTGYCIFYGSSLVSWKTKKQTTVSRSSAEAEYRSLAATVCEVQWISYLLRDFHLKLPTPVDLWCDNNAAIHITANPIFHERTKHLDIDCHLVRDQFKAGFILPQHIPSSQQLADLFTKPLPAPSFNSLLSKLNLADIHQSST